MVSNNLTAGQNELDDQACITEDLNDSTSPHQLEDDQVKLNLKKIIEQQKEIEALKIEKLILVKGVNKKTIIEQQKEIEALKLKLEKSKKKVKQDNERCCLF